MKNGIKILLLMLLLILCVSVVTVSAEETNVKPSLTVKSFSLSLENAVYMNFKVSSVGIDNKNDIKLLVWENVPEKYEKGTESAFLSTKGTEEESGYEVFQYSELSAKNMTKTIYFCAYANVNGKDVYSKPAKFSIAMYAYLKRNADNPDLELLELLDSMLDYGALAQNYFDYDADRPANSNMYQISVKAGGFEGNFGENFSNLAGVLDDGFTKGWYFEGETFTLKVPFESHNRPYTVRFSHWENSSGEIIGTDEELTLLATKDETYTAVYAPGFDYALSEDGTYYTVSEDMDFDIDMDWDELIFPSEYKGLPVKSIHYCGMDSSATRVVIPEGITSVCIYDMSGLLDIEIANTVTDLNLSSIHSLESLTIPESVVNIASPTFLWCNIKNIEVSENNTAYKSIDGNLYTKDGKSLIRVADKGLDTLVIPDGVERIENDAFSSYGTALKKLYIPESLNYIGENSLYSCEIENVYITDIAKWCEITFSNPNWSNPLASGGKLYLNDVLLTDLDFSEEEVTSINSFAFYGYKYLETLVLPSSIEYVGEAAFCACENLYKADVGCKYVSRAMFSSCTNLRIVNLDVGNIGEYAFGNCKSLTGIYIPSSVTAIGESAFENCSALVNVNIASGVSKIGKMAFVGTKVNNVYIPGSVTTIGESAFKNCSALVSVNIGSGVSKIGDFAFYGTAITSIKIPGSVETIGESAFEECSKLNSVVISSGTSKIGYSAFYNCSLLNNIILSDTVTRIESYAFAGYNSLTDVYYKGTKSEYERIVLETGNASFENAKRYYYSATMPTEEGDFWYYDDGIVVIWPPYKALSGENYQQFQANFYANEYKFIDVSGFSYANELMKEMESDEWLIASIEAWEILKIATDSSYESGKISKQDLYMMAIYDILTGDSGDLSNPIESLENDTLNYSYEASKLILGDDYINMERLKSISMDAYNQTVIASGIFYGVDCLSDVLGIYNNAYDAIIACSRYQAIAEMDAGFEIVLRAIYNDTTNDLDLRYAAKECISCVKQSSQNMKDKILAGEFFAATMQDFASDVVDYIWEGIIFKIFPQLKAIDIAVQGITFLSDSVFNLSETNKAFYKLQAAVGVERAVRNLLTNNTYNFESTSDCSEYMYGIEFFQRAIIVGMDYSKELLETRLDSILTNKETCRAQIENVENIKADRLSAYSQIESICQRLYDICCSQ